MRPAGAIALLAASGLSLAGGLDAPEKLDDGLAVAAPADAGLRPEPLDALDQAAVDAAFPRTTGVLVAKDGRLVFERYFEGGGRDLLNDTRSAMKSVTALAVGTAIADGVLKSVNEPAFARLSDLAPFAHDGELKRAITLVDFLTMSSALDCNDWDEASPGNEENMYPRRDWSRWAADIPVKADYGRDASGRGPFSYCTAGVFLLGQIVQRALKEPMDEYIARRLFAPLGIARHQWPRSPSGEVQTGGGLRLRGRDLVRLGLLVSSGGRRNGEQVVPAPWIKEMLTVRRRVDDEQNYGYLYWQRQYRSPCGQLTGWFMSGNGGNVVVHVAERGIVAAVTRTHYNNRDMHGQTVRLLEDHVFAALDCQASAG